MNKYLRISLVLIFVLILLGIRKFQSQIFYDPFLEYFEGDFQSKPLPQYDSLKLFGSIFLRYILNSAISIGIIFLLFPKRKNIKITLILYSIFGIICLLAYGIMVIFDFPFGYLPVFYVRRFLLQPLLLLILIPSFYYLYYKDSIEQKQ